MKKKKIKAIKSRYPDPKDYTKEQKEAINSLICMLDELNNKPRRLFTALRTFTEAFIDKEEGEDYFYEIIDSLKEAEEQYYMSNSRGWLIQSIFTTGNQVKDNLLKTKNLRHKTEEERFEYKTGVIDTTREITSKAITRIIEDDI